MSFQKLNIPDTDFPVRFRQRIENETYEFAFRTSQVGEVSWVAITIRFQGDEVVTQTPVRFGAAVGLVEPDCPIMLGTIAEGDQPLTVTEQRLRDRNVELIVIAKP